MIARVITAQVQPDKLDETVRLFREAGGPALARPGGPRGSWLLLDRNTCKCLALTLWDNEADMREGESGGPPPATASVAHTFASTPTCEVFEVSVPL